MIVEKRVCNGGFVAGEDCYWYRGCVSFEGGRYVVSTSETADLGRVWAGREVLRDDPDADGHWIERRPMDCWERVA